MQKKKAAIVLCLLLLLIFLLQFTKKKTGNFVLFQFVKSGGEIAAQKMYILEKEFNTIKHQSPEVLENRVSQRPWTNICCIQTL